MLVKLPYLDHTILIPNNLTKREVSGRGSAAACDMLRLTHTSVSHLNFFSFLFFSFFFF